MHLCPHVSQLLFSQEYLPVICITSWLVYELQECFSQSKDELILGFAQEAQEVYIRANLNPQICLLQITSDFQKSQKNSIDLFARLRGKKVSSVRVYPFERSFAIDFEEWVLPDFQNARQPL